MRKAYLSIFVVSVYFLSAPYSLWAMMETDEEQSSSSHSSSENNAVMPVLRMAERPVLDFSGQADLTDEVFCAALKNNLFVKRLSIKGCTGLSESAIKCVKNLTHLQELDLTGCHQIKDKTVSFIATRLESSLQKIILDGIPGLLFDTVLKLRGVGIKIPEDSTVYRLEIHNQSIDDEELAEKINKFPHLEYLSLSHCPFITEVGLQKILWLKGLKDLDIRHCEELPPSMIEKFKQKLNEKNQVNHSNRNTQENEAEKPIPQFLNFFQRKRVTDEGVRKALEEYPFIKNLSLSGCKNLTSGVLEEVAKLQELRDLDLSSLPLTGEKFENLVQLKNLKSLALGMCVHITLKGFDSIGQLLGLESLDLSACHQIRDEHLQKLSPLTRLRSLSILRCPLITDELVSLSFFPNLTSLNIQECTGLTEKFFLRWPDSLSLKELYLSAQTTDVMLLEVVKKQSIEKIVINHGRLITR